MNSEIIWQLVRYLLLIGGSWLTNKGYVDNDSVQTAIGALGTLFTFLWGVYIKWNTKSVPAEVGARPSVPTLSPITGQVEPPTKAN
jgi:hypothetical protein